MATTPAPYTTDFASKRETYQAALASLFSGKPEETEADLSKLCTPEFTMRADSLTVDFPSFVAHIRRLREILPSVALEVTQFLRDGSQLAERHNGVTTHPDGKIVHSETFQFAQIAEDGRIAWIIETVNRKT